MMNYSLVENRLTEEPDDYMARTVSLTTKKRSDLVKDITGPGSILKETECNAVINNYWKKIIDYVGQGALYRDEHIGVRIDIVGVFMGEDDRFDPERHELKLSIIPSNELKNALSNVSLTKVKAEKTVPEIDQVYDWGSNTTNQVLTPNDTIEISGDNLKVYEDGSEQGVFFINNGNGAEVKASVIRTNEPMTLSLRVPALESGQYRIEVRNTARNAKTMRIGMSPVSFTVA